MKLINLKTQEEFEAETIELAKGDFRKIKKSKQFLFDWSLEKGNQVFKIVESSEEENKEIFGLISLVNFQEEFRIHINLIESSIEHTGKNKKVDRIAGCLLAFATKLAFEKGYLGFTSLVPKTKLIELYVSKYGFTQYGRQLAIERQSAVDLIQKYL